MSWRALIVFSYVRPQKQKEIWVFSNHLAPSCTKLCTCFSYMFLIRSMVPLQRTEEQQDDEK